MKHTEFTLEYFQKEWCAVMLQLCKVFQLSLLIKAEFQNQLERPYKELLEWGDTRKIFYKLSKVSC